MDKNIGKFIEINGVKYGVSKAYPLFDKAWGDATYEIIETTTIREKEFFAWFPLYIKGKFRFLQRVLVTQRLIVYRFIDVEDYPDHPWNEWEEKWDYEEII